MWNPGPTTSYKELYSHSTVDVGKTMTDQTKKKINIDRSEPLEMDNRGRVTIPSNIRSKHGIQPDEDKTIWLEVNIEEAEIEYDKDGDEVTA